MTAKTYSQKFIDGRIDYLNGNIDALKSAKPEYARVGGGTYLQALAELYDQHAKGNADLQSQFARDDGTYVVRPLTFQETIEVIVESYESGDKTLLKGWYGSCTGVRLKEGTTKFKIVPTDKSLITFSSANYEDKEGIEVDSSKGKYDMPLTKSEENFEKLTFFWKKNNFFNLYPKQKSFPSFNVLFCSLSSQLYII